jgi:excisionase family DNA binding protein
MENQKFVTVKEVAACLMVSKKAIYQWAELRQIPSYKLNGCLRFKLNEVLEWAETCKVPSISGRTLDRANRRKVPA